MTNSRQDWPLPDATPEDIGFSSGRQARIAPAMQKYIDNGELPCVITLVARHGKSPILIWQGT